jgi:adenylate cyclase
VAISPDSTAASRRRIQLCGIVPALIAALLALYRPALFAALDDGVYDNFMRWAGTNPHSGRVVVVNVDEKSMAQVGQWPWRRDIIGRLIERLREKGAAIVAIDIILPEPDERPSGPGSQAAQSPDAALAASLGRGRVVLGYAFTFDGDTGSPAECVQHPVGVAVIQSREDSGAAPLFQATGAVCSLPMLGHAAGASGFLNAAPDSDGILRRVPLLIQRNAGIYPQLALAAVSAATGVRPLALRVSNVNRSSLIVDNWVVPLDAKGNLLVRYRGEKQTFPYVSAADVLNGAVPAESLRDKIAFVGTTALGTREVVATPLDTLFTGVEVQATVADNLLQQDFIGRHELARPFETVASLGLGLMVSLLIARSGFVWGAFAAIAGLAALWLGGIWSFAVQGTFLSPLFPTLGVVVGVGAMTLARITIERSRADTARHERAAAQQLMIQSLLSLTEVRDLETGKHSRRTQQYARLLADQLSTQPGYRDYLTPERIHLLSTLAPLHDIGKVGVPDAVLNKPGALTPDELAEMRRHPIYGREVIIKAEQRVGVRDDAILNLAKDIVYTHHERWDGTGYPQGLRGASIPVPGRLMAVVDVYDATTTRTLYRPCITHSQAVELIVAGIGTHFDPAVVDAFLRVASDFERLSHEADVA